MQRQNIYNEVLLTVNNSEHERAARIHQKQTSDMLKREQQQVAD
jgi:hypothetical protein